MSPNKRKPLLRSLFLAHLACGCGTSRPNHRNVHQPKPRPKPKSTSSSSNDGESPSTLLSPSTAHHSPDQPGPPWHHPDQEKKNTMMSSPNSTPSSTMVVEVSPSDALSFSVEENIGQSIAISKESEDPYEDFRHSMLQMIFENQIFSTEDLHHLLRCFLRLNSPAHHHIILRAFFQVCDAVVSSSTSSDHSNKCE